MDWFEGGVGEAIKACREKQCLLIVFVSDELEASTATLQALDSDEVINVLQENDYIALKISKDSIEYNQFSQFYNVFFFPSIFGISYLGKALVAMHGQQNSEAIKMKLTEAFTKMTEQTQALSSASIPPSVDNGNSAKETSDGSVQPPAPVLPTDTICGMQDTEGETPEEKKKRYEQKIVQRREEKVKASKEHEKEEEKTRRELGRNVAKSKGAQREQQNKNWLMERKKEKREQMLAREHIRSKLEQDRREREDAQRSSSLKHRHQKSAKPSSFKSSSKGCRIQLRLPMGPTRVVELNSTDTLALLREKASEILEMNSSNFSLVSVYPHQELTLDKDPLSMQQLNLTPSGVIIVKVQKKSSGKSNVMWAALMGIFSFFVWLFSMTRNALSSLFSTQTPGSVQSLPRSPGILEQNETKVRKFRPEDYQDDSSDDMGTYNGNSTQQH